MKKLNAIEVSKQDCMLTIIKDTDAADGKKLDLMKVGCLQRIANALELIAEQMLNKQ